MERRCGDFRLWVVAMDTECAAALRALDLPGMTVLDLEAVETDTLRSVKSGRTRAEYCWTLTPFTPDFVRAADPGVSRVTYVDADLWFAQDPTALLAELESSGKSVLITEHAYAPEYDQSENSGHFCVQFMPFDAPASDDVLHWWQDRCIEWCFARFEDGKFGDQKYLDDWPERFPDAVHVLDDAGKAQGPWNALRFPAERAVTFHFHRLRTISDDRAVVGMYRIPSSHLETLYRPYLADLRWAYGQLAGIGAAPRPMQEPLRGWAGFKDRLAFKLRAWRSPLAPYSLKF
jgi:hypothetical protein